MMPHALKKLRCPDCVEELELRTFDDPSVNGEGNVQSGVLLCARCRLAYPIEAETPVMLRFTTRFHDRFAVKHANQLSELGEYSLPHGTPRPGELAVQESFTDEWNLTTEDELSFGYTAEQLVDLNRRVWLRWLDRVPAEQRPRSLLNVGCGAGMETNALREVTGAEEIFAIDLNFAVLGRRPEFRRQPGVTFVVASLFDLPFERHSFDLVYSQGVIHHTYSSDDAFKSISGAVRPGGELFVWVYGLEDHLAPTNADDRISDLRMKLAKRRHHLFELIFRPLLSRSSRRLRDPIFKLLSRLQHASIRRGSWNTERWRLENTEHSMRDWLSPRYARRHGYNEVIEWFETNGFEVFDTQSPAAYRELFGTPLFGIGMTGRRHPVSPIPEREPVAESARG